MSLSSSFAGLSQSEVEVAFVLHPPLLRPCLSRGFPPLAAASSWCSQGRVLHVPLSPASLSPGACRCPRARCLCGTPTGPSVPCRCAPGARCSGPSELRSTVLGSPGGRDGRWWESSWPKSWSRLSVEHGARSRPTPASGWQGWLRKAPRSRWPPKWG